MLFQNPDAPEIDHDTDDLVLASLVEKKLNKELGTLDQLPKVVPSLVFADSNEIGVASKTQEDCLLSSKQIKEKATSS